MKKDQFDPTVDGSIQSLETTPTQKKLIGFIGYFAKVAKIISSEEAVYLVEQPNGLQNFLKAKEIREKAQDGKKLSRDEIRELELKERYGKLRKPLGNSTPILNHLLGDAMTSTKARKLMEDAIKEANEIAFKSALGAETFKQTHDGDFV